MKKTNMTMAAVVALAAFAGSQAFASSSSTKEDVITFSLTEQGQSSVSTTSGANVGDFSAIPFHYKTSSKKLTQTDLLHGIGLVLHGSASYYSSSAKLVLVQGELSGFFNITPDLSNTAAVFDPTLGNFGGLTSTNISGDSDTSTALAVGTDSLFTVLDNGRNFEANPITGLLPVGHLQPWGQIFVKDTGKSGYSVTSPLYENVTYFFALTVQECYDCFYLNSFISDSTFAWKAGQAVSGPPCCSTATNIVGHGTDKYYLTLSFDDTVNNPYLNNTNNNSAYNSDNGYNSLYVGVDGLLSDHKYFAPYAPEGIVPDALPYSDSIKAAYDTANPSIYPYVLRFTLNGIVTYNWTLAFINNSDVAPEFVGTATYAANGYGFSDLICQLITGTVTFSEKTTKSVVVLNDNPGWYDSWYGIGYYPYVDASGVSYGNLFFQELQNYNATYTYSDQDSAFNTGANLTYHANFNEAYEPWEVSTNR
jgi:hypothetical protein